VREKDFPPLEEPVRRTRKNSPEPDAVHATDPVNLQEEPMSQPLSPAQKLQHRINYNKQLVIQMQIKMQNLQEQIKLTQESIQSDEAKLAKMGQSPTR